MAPRSAPSPTPPPIPPTPLPYWETPEEQLPSGMLGRKEPRKKSGLVALVRAGGSDGDRGLAVGKATRPTHSLNKQVILDEDDYTSAMSSIIARDFFPSLERLEATNKYLEAVDSMDEQQLEASVRRLIEVDSGRTPARFLDERHRGGATPTPRFEQTQTPIYGNPIDTPLRRPDLNDTPSAYSTFSSSTSKRRRPAPAPSATLSLDAFQSSFTSEDNASFTEILHDENKNRKEKHSWAWVAEKRAKVLKIEEEKGIRRLIERAHREEDRKLIGGVAGTGKEGESKMIEGGSSEEVVVGEGEGGRLTKEQKGKGKDVEGGPAPGVPPLPSFPSLPSLPPLEDATTDTSTSTTSFLPSSFMAVDDPEDAEVERMLYGYQAPSSDHPPITTSSSSTALITQPSSDATLALISYTSSGSPPLPSADLPLPPDSHLAIALVNAGLPPTAIDHQLAARRRDQVGDVLAAKADERKVLVPAWDYKTRNALMFGPDADVSPFDPVLSTESKSLLGTAPKTIIHSNTRLPSSYNNDDGSIAASAGGEIPPSPTRSHIAAAISGTPYPASQLSTLPSISGYPLVPSLPSPTPSSLGPERIHQLMTWGHLLSTPRALPSESGPTPFRINDPSPRDELARKLAQEAGRSISERAKGMKPSSSSSSNGAGKKRKTGGGDMGPPSWTPASASSRGLGGSLGGGGGGSTSGRRAGSSVELSPAGRGLLERTRMGGLGGLGGGGVLGGRSAAGRRGEVMDKGWGLGGSGGKSKDVRSSMRWSASPSPVVKRGGDD